MAIYQYYLTVIPRQAIQQHWGIIPTKVQVHNNPLFDEDDLINIKWWSKLNIDFRTIEKRILEFVDQVEWTKSSEAVKTFGDNDTNDITIVKNDLGKLDEMVLRIDLKKIDKLFIDRVLTMVRDLNCLLLDRGGNLFEPVHERLWDNIQKSNAFKFVSNPTDFLSKLGKEIEME